MAHKVELVTCWAEPDFRAVVLRPSRRDAPLMLAFAMNFPWNEHFDCIVVPAWQAYMEADARLAEAAAGDDPLALELARYRALREGGAAAIYLHHFADIVMRAKPDWLPPEVRGLETLRTWVAAHCTSMRTEQASNDVSVLKDVADALKHAVLTHNVQNRAVAANDAVVTISSAWDAGRWDEVKWDGVEQVVVVTHDGQRALSAILQNVIDAWRRCANLHVPALGEP